MRRLDWDIKPIIGMIHLLPLPGSFAFDGDFDVVLKRAIDDARTLKQGGCDALMIENHGDAPYEIGENIDVSTFCAITTIINKLQSETDLPLGLSCVSNGVLGSIAIAASTSVSFIRCSSWTNGYFNAYGYVKPIASKALKHAKSLCLDHLEFLSDICVKNGSHFLIHDKTLKDHFNDAQHAKADGIIITGTDSGVQPQVNDVLQIKRASKIKIILGSGADRQNIKEFLPICDGMIVGSHFKNDGDLDSPIILERVQNFMNLVNQFRKENSLNG